MQIPIQTSLPLLKVADLPIFQATRAIQQQLDEQDRIMQNFTKSIDTLRLPSAIDDPAFAGIKQITKELDPSKINSLLPMDANV